MIAIGISQEEIYVDKGNIQIKVMTPTQAKPEIVEILEGIIRPKYSEFLYTIWRVDINVQVI